MALCREKNMASVIIKRPLAKRRFVCKVLFANMFVWLQTKATFWFRNYFFSGKYTEFIK